MTDEQLHEYWQVTEENRKRKRKKILTALLIIALVVGVIYLIFFTPRHWKYEDIKLDIVPSGYGDTLCIQETGVGGYGRIYIDSRNEYFRDEETQTVYFETIIRLYSTRYVRLRYGNEPHNNFRPLFYSDGTFDGHIGPSQTDMYDVVEREDENGIIHKYKFASARFIYVDQDNSEHVFWCCDNYDEITQKKMIAEAEQN